MDRDTLRLWKQRLDTDRAAQSVHHERWKRAIRLFDTTYWDALKRQNSQVVEVNYSTTFITTLVAAVFARYPKWRIEAKRPGRFYKFAETMAILMEQYKDEVKLKELFIKAVVDAATCNIGWIEQGFYASMTEPLPAPETGQDDMGMKRRMSQLFNQLTGKVKPDESPAYDELNQQKREGSFFAIRRSPWDVIIPQGCCEYDSLPYITVRDRMTYGDFLARKDLKNQDRMGVIGIKQSQRKLDVIRTSPYTSGAMYNPKANSSITKGDPDRPVEIFNTWDRRENQVFTYSETSDECHKEPEDWPYFAEGFPQKPLQFNYVPDIPDEEDNFYGFSDIDPIEAQLLEKSDLRTQQSVIRKRSIVKVFVQQGSATESTLSKLASSDIEIIPVPNIQAIQISQGIQIPPAVLQMEERIDSDLSRDSGMSLLLADAAQQGAIDRATVANIAQQSTSIKTNYKVDRIEACVKEVGLFQVGLFWQYLSKDEVAERLGRVPSDEEWIPLPQDIRIAKKWVRDELKLAVEAGSTKPLNVDVLERDNYMNSLAIIQNVAPDLFAQLKRPLIATLVKKFNEPALEQMIMSALDPQEQQSAQMENQLMMQGMPQVVGPHDDHMTHMAMHQQLANNPIVAAHMQAHQVRMQELAGNQKQAGQGVRQKADAPSAAEIGQGGVTRGMDIQGATQRVGSPGSQANAG